MFSESDGRYSFARMCRGIWMEPLKEKINIQRSPPVSPPIFISHFSPSSLLGRAILKDSSVQFSHSVVSNSLQADELQCARPPCPSPTPGVYPNPCPLSWWCYPTISSSIVLFSCPQSFPASGPFPMSWLFTSGGQNIGLSASASVLPMNIQGWFPFRIDWFDLLAVQGTLKSLLQHHS